MSRFKFCLLIIFCIAVSISLAGCGTLKGLGHDVRVIGEILEKV